MKILYLTQWFDPEPFFKGINYVKKMKKKGHHVEVLTGFPNYPTGKLYDGYKIKLWKKEKINGISVIRTALFPSHSRSKIGRIINYFSFAMSSTLFGLIKIKNNFDLIYVYHPPITVGLTALIMKFIWRIPYIYEIQDIWPETLRATGMVQNNFTINFIGKLCELVYQGADSLIVISPGFKKKLIEKGVDEEKIHVIYNCSDEVNIFPKEKNHTLLKEFKFEKKFNVVFAGNMGKAQALESVLDAALLINKQFPKVQFVFIGGGIEVSHLKKISNELNLSNILFLKPVPLDKIGEILTLSDILLVHLKDDPLFEITIPGKTQTYMALGKPIIMGVKGDAVDLLDRANAGIACEPQNPESIRNAIAEAYKMPRKELENLGKNGRVYYTNKLCLDVGLGKLSNIFDSVGSKYYNK